MRGYGEGRQAEKLAARGGLIPHYRVHDAPEQQPQQEQAQYPGKFSVARAKWLGAGSPPAGRLPRRRVVAAVASRAKHVQPRSETKFSNFRIQKNSSQIAIHLFFITTVYIATERL